MLSTLPTIKTRLSKPSLLTSNVIRSMPQLSLMRLIVTARLGNFSVFKLGSKLFPLPGPILSTLEIPRQFLSLQHSSNIFTELHCQPQSPNCPLFFGQPQILKIHDKFVCFIRGHTLKPHDVMISFDVPSLHPLIPVKSLEIWYCTTPLLGDNMTLPQTKSTISSSHVWNHSCFQLQSKASQWLLKPTYWLQQKIIP